ncbi:hypothetical protein OQA88_4770 [Cercophora sp. LCS_1]
MFTAPGGGGGGGGGRHGRMSAGPGPRSHSGSDFGGDARGPHPSSNLQTFYATQRHQSSRGSNEAEQMMQAKRRMAAQRERELRNYHQEQQYNRTVLSDFSPYGPKPDRALSPGGMSEEDRRKLIAQQRSALYGEGAFAENPGYVDETGTARPGLPNPQMGPASLRGHSPLTYEYGRVPPLHDGPSQAAAEGAQGSHSAGPNERSRANSNSSPQSNPAGGKGFFDAPTQQSSRTSASSPGGSPPRQGVSGSKSGQGSVAPIGTRPSNSGAPTNPALNKRSTTPLPSPLSQGYTAPGNDDGNTGSGPTPLSAIESSSGGLSGWGGRSTGWGSKQGLDNRPSVSSVWG